MPSRSAWSASAATCCARRRSRSASIKQPGYEYHAYHVTYELDLLLELLDKLKPEVIVNFAAQGEGAVSWKNSWRFFETNSMALARLCEELMKRDWLERFIQIGTSEMYGSVSHAAKEDEPIKPTSPLRGLQSGVRHAPDVDPQVPQFPMNVIRPSNAYCPGSCCIAWCRKQSCAG
jgi:dTDP-glucose 4,6-dehydratase